jgi:hypothetical protein
MKAVYLALLVAIFDVIGALRVAWGLRPADPVVLSDGFGHHAPKPTWPPSYSLAYRLTLPYTASYQQDAVEYVVKYERRDEVSCRHHDR